MIIPATKETKNFIREEHFRKMKPETVFINISRADNVDEQALLKAIENNWIKGAILDVIKDPRDPNNPLLKKENIIYTPHIAGRTTNTRVRELEIIVQNIENLRKNDTLINIVNLDLEY